MYRPKSKEQYIERRKEQICVENTAMSKHLCEKDIKSVHIELEIDESIKIFLIVQIN